MINKREQIAERVALESAMEARLLKIYPPSRAAEVVQLIHDTIVIPNKEGRTREALGRNIQKLDEEMATLYRLYERSLVEEEESSWRWGIYAVVMDICRFCGERNAYGDWDMCLRCAHKHFVLRKAIGEPNLPKVCWVKVRPKTAEEINLDGVTESDL